MNTTENHAAPPRSPIAAINICLRKSFDFSGRASRSEFWWFWLAMNVFSYALYHVYPALKETVALDYTVIGISFLLLLSVSVRRLHDTGRGAWHLLFLSIPFILVPILSWYEWGEQTVLENFSDGIRSEGVFGFAILSIIFIGWMLAVFILWLFWFTQKGTIK